MNAPRSGDSPPAAAQAPSAPELTGQPLRMIPPAPGQSGPAAEDLGRVHFVGIGGVGMSGLARIYVSRGLPTSGSDMKENREVVALRALGADITLGNAAGNVAEADTVVVSTAIRDTNPEVVEARRRGLRILHRAEALAAAMSGRRVITVAGTHGKTTTTSLIVVALQHCAADPSFAIGGSLNESGANAHSGSGDLFVAEADESDGSFLAYRSDIAVVTNVEADHLDYFADQEAVDAAFRAFVDRMTPGGTLVACADDPGACRLVSYAQERGVAVRTYGEGELANVRLLNVTLDSGGSTFELVDEGRRMGTVSLQVPGKHNVLNAAAAYTAGVAAGQSPTLLREGLELYTGTRRRFELKGVGGGVRVIDDYAHHPTEIAATLQAARQVVGSGRLVVTFQPHRYSRTAALGPELGASLGLADEVVVMEVYSSGEDPIPGASGSAVAAAVPLPAESVVFVPSWSAVAGELARRARPGDIVLTLGAGDVTMIGPEVLTLLQGDGVDEAAPASA